MTGTKLSEETKKKMSESRKGRKLTKYQKQKLLESNINKVVSDSTKKKLSEAFQGSKSNFAILNEKEVEDIKHLIMNGVKDNEIAEIYNVKPSCISNIRYDYRWKHVFVIGWEEYQLNRKKNKKHT